MASILILGGGFGGLAAAHELRARLPHNHDVTVVAASDRFYAGFAKLWDLVALGAGPGPEHFLHLHGPAHDLYDTNELPKMRTDLAQLDAGTLAIAVLDAPYKCPPAPYEAALLLDEHLRGVRDSFELVITTPQPMTLPAAGPEISRFVADSRLYMHKTAYLCVAPRCRGRHRVAK
ncbi:MAG: hypothetical protein M3317_05070 [Actinomycetota bacterium]|nr:hypothetical protein [Actinomycetota bacterium]